MVIIYHLIPDCNITILNLMIVSYVYLQILEDEITIEALCIQLKFQIGVLIEKIVLYYIKNF